MFSSVQEERDNLMKANSSLTESNEELKNKVEEKEMR